MPFTKEKNRRIYITALVISFLLIVGSIYLHLRQKTHLGRMSFNLDRDRVKPTSGVDLEASKAIDEYDSKYLKETEEDLNTGEDDDEDDAENSAEHDKTELYTDSKTFETDEEDITVEIEKDENNKENLNDYLDEDYHESNYKDSEEKTEAHLQLMPNDFNSCFRCLCMAVNECRPTFCGTGNPCGLYRISKSYWTDSGKPTIAGGSTDNPLQDYLTCINDDTCSANVIRGYYNRYKRDCNKDGLFDCRDLIALHMLGPSGCLTENLSYIHEKRMRDCFIESNHDYLFSAEEDY